LHIAGIPARKEGRIAIVTKRWAGMRWTLATSSRAFGAWTNGEAAYGEVVWS
jgi:hypothetical protein